jgi:hypothetical protein
MLTSFKALEQFMFGTALLGFLQVLLLDQLGQREPQGLPD